MSWPAPTGDPIRPRTDQADASLPPVATPAPVTAAPQAPTAAEGRPATPATVGPPTEPQAPAAAHGGIAVLEAADAAQPQLAPISPRTGQPVRPWTIWTSAALSFAAAAAVTVGLLLAWWQMASPWQQVDGGWSKVDKFNEATWLTAQFPSEPASGWRVFFAIAGGLIAVLVAGATSVIGYYAFAGYRWARVGALVALGVSLLALLLTPIAAIAIGCAALAAVPLWLPPTQRYFARWHLLRHPQIAYSEPVENVFYGPLPRYR